MGVDWTPERLRICQVRVTPGFLFVAALLLYQSTPSFLVTFLLAAALHEGGHLLAARWRGVPVRALSMTAFGCVLDFADGALVRDKDLLCIAAAGPLCNLLFALACIAGIGDVVRRHVVAEGLVAGHLAGEDGAFHRDV